MRSMRRACLLTASIVLATGLVSACNTGDSKTPAKAASSSAQQDQPTVNLPAWKLPNVKVVKTFKGSNSTDTASTDITMSDGTTAFAWRFVCTGGTDDSRNGQYMGLFVNGVGEKSVSEINGAAWQSKGAGYTPVSNLVAVNSGEAVHIQVTGKCVFELGQITDKNAPLDPILQTP
jgi:hypothetical protein